jgi:predicted transcriptional regulator
MPVGGREVPVERAGARVVPVDDDGRVVVGESVVVRADQTLYDAVDVMLRAGRDSVVVVDERGRPVGVLPWAAVVRERSGRGGS